MRPTSCSWLVFFVCFNVLGSTTACIRKLDRAINGGSEAGIIPLIGRVMRGLMATGNNYAPGTVGYGSYSGQYPGSYSTYNNQPPLGSTSYYPNQALGPNVQTQLTQPYNSGPYGQTQPTQPYNSGPYVQTQPTQPYNSGPYVQTQPTQPYNSGGLPVQSNLSPQPYPNGSPYQPAMMTNVQPPVTTTPVVQPAMVNVQPQPVVTTPAVQAGIPQRYRR